MSGLWAAFGLTLFAGMATGIGSSIAFWTKRTDYRFLSISTGFSAGVMLYVSFVEIFFKGAESLAERYGDYWSNWINAAGFFQKAFGRVKVLHATPVGVAGWRRSIHLSP